MKLLVQSFADDIPWNVFLCKALWMGRRAPGLRIKLEKTRQNSMQSIAVIGGGPAGLMAAEVLLEEGLQVVLYDAMPSLGRKFLRAGKGGLNLTHSESFEKFLSRYGERRSNLDPIIRTFTPTDLREWLVKLGYQTYTGSSGRVFPETFNSSPILRAWLDRLKGQGLKVYTRHKWLGWEHPSELQFETPAGKRVVKHPAVVVALGGGSWPQLGSDGGWVSFFMHKGIVVQPLKPANCGFNLEWTDHFSGRFHGEPVKPVLVIYGPPDRKQIQKQGEFIITRTGLEGGLIYALSAYLRDEIDQNGSATIELDLAPDWDYDRLLEKLLQPRGSRTVSTHLKKSVGIGGVKAGLLYEVLPREAFNSPERVASAIKRLPLTLVAPRPLEEAISSAGGVPFEELDQSLMLKKFPGIFCAGEMLDWEAPTGGYLLTACFATGRWAGKAAASWVSNRENLSAG